MYILASIKNTLILISGLLLLLIIFLTSCRSRSQEIVNTGIFEVQLKSWSFFNDADYLVVYNNLPNQRFERKTLTINKTYKEEQPSDTLKVKMSKEQEDSIHYFAYKYISEFKIDDIRGDINGKRIRQVNLDGGNFSISFRNSQDTKLEVTKYRTAGFRESQDEASKLVAFINRNLPENFRIYKKNTDC